MNLMEREKNSRKRIQKKEVTLNVPIIKTPRAIQGFLEFIRGYGVIAIAIGLFLGASLKSIVDSLTQNVINPIIGALTNNVNLNSASACIKSVNGICQSNIKYGAVLSTIISFLIAAFIVYLIVKILRLDKFDQKKDK
jgi:large conductance mechanosensitive channel protein